MCTLTTQFVIKTISNFGVQRQNNKWVRVYYMRSFFFIFIKGTNNSGAGHLPLVKQWGRETATSQLGTHYTAGTNRFTLNTGGSQAELQKKPEKLNSPRPSPWNHCQRASPGRPGGRSPGRWKAGWSRTPKESSERGNRGRRSQRAKIHIYKDAFFFLEQATVPQDRYLHCQQPYTGFLHIFHFKIPYFSRLSHSGKYFGSVGCSKRHEIQSACMINLFFRNSETEFGQ